MKPVDIIVLVIVICVCFVVLVPGINSMVSQTQLSEEKAALISGLVTSMIAIVSIYVGSKLRGGD